MENPGKRAYLGKIIQGDNFHWASPKNLKYGKPREGGPPSEDYILLLVDN